MFLDFFMTLHIKLQFSQNEQKLTYTTLILSSSFMNSINVAGSYRIIYLFGVHWSGRFTF
jgi:hypothetical protein